METAVYYGEMDSLIGPLTLCATEQGLCLVKFGSFVKNAGDIGQWLKEQMGLAKLYKDSAKLSGAVQQLEAYFSGELREFSLPLDMRGTVFQRQVWEALCTVPYGEAASYKDIAVLIGNPKAVRAVGGANNRNPVPVIVPCHRIIGAGGALVGYAGGLGIKSTLLQLEAEHGLPDRTGAYLF
ncbi:methylated-DNA--[protein]-cysteine S-methyltransferase [Paenibacillus sp. S150]|nr:methylated-DNA--[protein]-cysteine S-methyltransferase [Paenibacillus sp. S150]